MVAKKLIISDNSNEDTQIDRHNFEWLSALLLELTGIDLKYTPKNVTLMSSRLGKVMRKKKIVIV